MGSTNQMTQRIANMTASHLSHEHLEHFMDQGGRNIGVSNQALSMEHGCLPQLMNQGAGDQHPEEHPMGRGENPFTLGKMMGQR